jgi:hypothetical protein
VPVIRSRAPTSRVYLVSNEILSWKPFKYLARIEGIVSEAPGGSWCGVQRKGAGHRIVSVVTVNVMNLTFLVSAWQKED